VFTALSPITGTSARCWPEQTLDEIVLNSCWYTDNHTPLHAGKKVVKVDIKQSFTRTMALRKSTTAC
jgi:NAD(P)H-nitrite reductase large subunit